MRLMCTRLSTLRHIHFSPCIKTITRPSIINMDEPVKLLNRAISSSSQETSGENAIKPPRYIMPPEWSTHVRTITVWPDLSSVHDEDVLRESRKEVSSIANAIAQFEPVTMYTRNEHVELARETVADNVTVVGLEANQLWVRDSGPVMVRDGSTGLATGLCLNFNYWGGKLPQEGDEFVATKILSNMDFPVHVAPFQAEGGSIEIDGEGTLLTTESAIINSNRNPGMDKAQLEQYFYDVFGVTKTIWIPGIKGLEMTDYHIDAFVRFIKPGTVLLSKPAAKAEKIVQDAYDEAVEILGREVDASGRRLQVIEINEPDPAEVPGSEFGETVTSYVNYLLVNGGIIVPRFGVQQTDDDALELFQQHFPGRKIVQVDLNALPNTGGGIHCATQQVPAIEA